MQQMFNKIRADTVLKLFLEHVVFIKLILICIKEECKWLHSNIMIIKQA